MMQYVSTVSTQGICPIGWHLPSDTEWMTLEENLGMCSGTGSGCSGALGYRGTDEGSKLAGNEPLWTNGTLDQNANFGTSGFMGLPGGNRISNVLFINSPHGSFFWTSNENGSNAWERYLYFPDSRVYRESFRSKIHGFSVRCVQD